MTAITTDTTTQERELGPTFDFTNDDIKIGTTKRLAKEKIEVDTSKASPLKERVSPRSASSDSEIFSYDDDLESSVSGHNYLESNSYDSDFFDTPNSSPSKLTENPDTPQALNTLSAVMDKHHPGYDLSPTSKAAFKGALEKVNAWESPYKAKDKARQLFGAKLLQTESITEIHSPIVPRRLIFAAHDYEDVMGSWTTDLAKGLGFCFLDVKHLTDLEKNSGFHICGKDHPRNHSVIKRRTNIWTDVWCGQVCEEENPLKIQKNFSSFIPQNMDLKHYQSLLSQAINTPNCKIAQQDNRRLYRLDNTFVVECYVQDEGTRIKSAIPVFHYEVYNKKDEQFRVVYLCQDNVNCPECIGTYDVSYEKLFDLLPTCSEKTIVYDTEDKRIVDVALLFNDCPIEKGILVEIPKELL